MSRYFAAKFIDDNLIEFHDLIWRRNTVYPGWYRFYWGDNLIALITHNREGWGVILQGYGRTEENNQEYTKLSKMGQGFTTRYRASAYALKCVGIWE